MPMNMRRETTFSTGRLTLAELRTIVSMTEGMPENTRVRVKHDDGYQSSTTTVVVEDVQ